jgi:hypothetical protein
VLVDGHCLWKDLVKNAVESVIENTQSDPESEHTNYQREHDHPHSSLCLHLHFVFAPKVSKTVTAYLTVQGATCMTLRAGTNARDPCRRGGVDFRHAMTSGLFAGVRARHVADRSLEKMAAFLPVPQ